MKSKVFLLVFVLGCVLLLPSFSAERKIHLTEAEYNVLVEQMLNAKKQLQEYKAAQNQDLMKLNEELKNLSTYYKEQEKEWKKRTMIYSIVGFSAGMIFATGTYVLVVK